jgi:hypothetical protein
MESHIAIHNLFANYALANDLGDADRVEPMFVPEARFELSIAGKTVVGPFEDRDTQIAFFRETLGAQTDEQRRHFTTNFVIEHPSDSTAKVTAYLLITTTEKGAARVVATGLYDTELEQRDGEWLFTRMLIALDSGF